MSAFDNTLSLRIWSAAELELMRELESEKNPRKFWSVETEADAHSRLRAALNGDFLAIGGKMLSASSAAEAGLPLGSVYHELLARAAKFAGERNAEFERTRKVLNDLVRQGYAGQQLPKPFTAKREIVSAVTLFMRYDLTKSPEWITDATSTFPGNKFRHKGKEIIVTDPAHMVKNLSGVYTRRKSFSDYARMYFNRFAGDEAVILEYSAGRVLIDRRTELINYLQHNIPMK
jgi:hypothetical protein